MAQNKTIILCVEPRLFFLLLHICLGNCVFCIAYNWFHSFMWSRIIRRLHFSFLFLLIARCAVSFPFYDQSKKKTRSKLKRINNRLLLACSMHLNSNLTKNRRGERETHTERGKLVDRFDTMWFMMHFFRTENVIKCFTKHSTIAKWQWNFRIYFSQNLDDRWQQTQSVSNCWNVVLSFLRFCVGKHTELRVAYLFCVFFFDRTHQAVAYYASKNHDAPAASTQLCRDRVFRVCCRNEVKKVQQPAVTLRHNTFLLLLRTVALFMCSFSWASIFKVMAGWITFHRNCTNHFTVTNCYFIC